MVKRRSILTALFILSMGVCLYGCKKAEAPVETPPAEAEIVEEEVDDVEAYPEPEETEVVTPEEEEGDGIRTSYGKERERKDGKVRSYLTGKWVDESVGDHRPIAVMLNNIIDAQPMSGVSEADVIYECVVEGALTRMMGLFENYEGLDKIGSVRSCRNYFVYYALEFDAIYAHYGQSAYAVSLLEQDFVDNLSGLSSIGDIVFYRTNDRVAPHNAYASSKGIDAGIEKMGYRTTYRDDYKGKFTFAEDDEIIVPSTASSYDATIMKPGYVINKPWFEYNKDDHKYYRFQYDGPQIDDVNNQQLAVDNVIFQYSAWEQVDDKGYLGFDCHSGGDMIYFTQGKAEKGRWIRYDGDLGSARYYDSEGKEIILNQGKTWICIIQDTKGDKVEIE